MFSGISFAPRIDHTFSVSSLSGPFHVSLPCSSSPSSNRGSGPSQDARSTFAAPSFRERREALE